MKGMFLKKFDIYYQKCATVAQRFQLSMTKLGACDEIRWNDGTHFLFFSFLAQQHVFSSLMETRQINVPNWPAK
jgi:hypothetical protein